MEGEGIEMEVIKPIPIDVDINNSESGPNEVEIEIEKPLPVDQAAETVELLEDGDKELKKTENKKKMLTIKERLHIYAKGDGDKAFEGTTTDLQAFIIFISLFIIVGIPSSGALVYTNNLWTGFTLNEWLSAILSCSPLVTIELALGFPPFANYISMYITQSCTAKYFNYADKNLKIFFLLALSSIVPLCWFIAGLLLYQFNLLSFVYIFFTSFGVLEYLFRRRDEREFGKHSWNGIIGGDLLIFVILFAPLDFRWFETDYFYGPRSLGYDWWALAITVLAIVGWKFCNNMPGFGYRLIPTWKDFLIGFLFAVLLGIPIIPLGLWTGFLNLNWDELVIPSFLDVICLWWENILTVAITEEIFFRVVLMNGINQGIKRYNRFGWVGLFCSSIVFGLMHLPRRGELIPQLLYGLFAFIAGLCYGGSYILSGNNIIAAVISHSITDTVWAFLLQ